VVSIDLPSGNFDGWEPGMPLVEADLTLGIEPLKLCLYAPPARFAAGTILPVGGLFPPALMESYRGAELLDWKAAAALIPPVRADAHKYRRGVVEIHAGSPGAAGAARIAARGAQAAGAGIVRLLLDRELYPLLAPEAGGIMVVPRGPLPPGEGDRFRPSALLLGPGWGQDPSRQEILEWALEREAAGIPLILDADALRLAKDRVFHGNAILTPHPGEFAVLAGLPPPELPPQPGPLLLKIAREKQAVIVYKSSVIFVAAPDGRLACLDGMEPALAAGGSGDLLAGFCAALAGRMGRARWNGSAPDPAPADQSPPGQTVPGGQGGAGEAGLDQPASAPPVRAVPINQPSSGQTAPGGDAGDGYSCALAAAALLLESLRRGGLTKKFIDPLELAARAAETAGAAWL
jgi:NAD(P)H-hydrate epimerase